MGQQRKTYTDDFKAAAVDRLYEPSATQGSVAKEQTTGHRGRQKVSAATGGTNAFVPDLLPHIRQSGLCWPAFRHFQPHSLPPRSRHDDVDGWPFCHAGAQDQIIDTGRKRSSLSYD